MKTRDEIARMSVEELRNLYDETSQGHGQPSLRLTIIQDEIQYRQQRQTSNQMWFMTLFITILTISNVGLVAYQVFG